MEGPVLIQVTTRQNKPELLKKLNYINNPPSRICHTVPQHRSWTKSTIFPSFGKKDTMKGTCGSSQTFETWGA